MRPSGPSSRSIRRSGPMTLRSIPERVQRAVFRHGEDDAREYLELRRGHFRGYISCFVHGTDLYVGWTFWLYMSPLRLLVMVIGRNIRDAISRGKAIQRSLHFESGRALVAAMHGAALAGIDAASDQLDPG